MQRLPEGERDRLSRTGSIGAALALVALVLTGAAPAAAADGYERPERADIWDIELGTGAQDLPDAFVNYACGTDGGPPGRRLTSFADFASCPADGRGLHEVYIEYDDELEFWAKAIGTETEIEMYRGTQVYDYPVMTSVLFDDAGVVRGVRIITDPRQAFRQRGEYWTIVNFMKQRFGVAGWDCHDLPREEGEQAAGSYLIKDRCTKPLPGQFAIVERRYYQKRGQSFTDPRTGQLNTGAFVSEGRFEIFDDEVRQPDAG